MYANGVCPPLTGPSGLRPETRTDERGEEARVLGAPQQGSDDSRYSRSGRLGK